MRGFEAAEREYYQKLDSCRDGKSECQPEIDGHRKDGSLVYNCHNCSNERCEWWEEYNNPEVDDV